MAIALSNTDTKAIDEFLAFVVDAYKYDCVDRGNAVAVLARVLMAAAADDEGEVRSWLTSSTCERWGSERRLAA